ncbi:hypothetical protein [Halomonas sp. SpR8]|uniref:hypothetical protein n=1 Tax=Halomonas sp. SpR8 TaxID=3050463 RepID=UPI0027E3BD2E|nr:hypothetical protein [Halomonas sp. SpR8]MDQ7729752.1 hypothetical protein [Halomonas sp. SpR8]
MTTDSEQFAPWQAFIEEPTQYVALKWLCAELESVADDTTQAALARHPRFQQRLGEQLARRHGLLPPEALPVPEVNDLVLFKLPPEAGEDLVRYCGMICHARAFVHEIRATRVVELKQRFGELPYRAALSNRDVALHRHKYADDDALEHAVKRDGSACLAAWMARQSAGVTDWLRLGVLGNPCRADAEPSEEVHEHGPDIVRRASAFMIEHVVEETE